jgi:hypothetical protein
MATKSSERKSLKITPDTLKGLTELAREHKCGTPVRPSVAELCLQIAARRIRIRTPWSEERVCALISAFWRLYEQGAIREAGTVLELLREAPEVPLSTQLLLTPIQESGQAISEIGTLLAQGRSFKITRKDDSGEIATFLWESSKV